MRHRGATGISQAMLGPPIDPTLAQLEAIVTAMCLVGLADGELSSEELGTVGRQLDAAGWCEAMTEDQIDELLIRSTERAHAICELDDTARDDAIVHLVVELDSLELREAAHAMATAVAMVDGVPIARATLDKLARASCLV
jgi:hypothetical protein